MSDKSDKREHILSVAEELFAEKGFDGASVRDIAQRAGVNLAMISYYFGSKEKLLESLLEWRAGYAYGILDELNKDESLSQWDKVDRLVDFYVDRIINNMKFHAIMWQESSARSEEIKNRSIGIKLRNLEQITKIIADGQQKKLFRQVDIPMTVGTIMGTISYYTQSKTYSCVTLSLGEDINDEQYRQRLATRLKAHLKRLLRAHLDIKNDSGPMTEDNKGH
ncbi:MAG TPA: TetR/AcrR family transcriptional regulator [Puia sp.]|jgi:AcrR family transcriptional regulator|nr:TetR/AcrR family transcriptional regulator [Puia sp.]